MFFDLRITDLCLGLWYAMKETLLDPIDMTEELMFHMFNNDMNQELDGRWLDLYLSLQLYKEHLEKIERDEDSWEIYTPKWN